MSMDEKAKKILSSLQAQCVKREYCVKDIRAKALKATEGDEALTDELVSSLVEDRFVDNLRYAGAFAREKSAISGWGPVKIAYALAAKGIDRETVREALGDTDEAASDRKMESVIAAKYRTLEGDPQVKLKLLRFALSRGYSYDQVKDSVDNIVKNGQHQRP